MKELSQIAMGVQASTTMAIDTMFKEMRANGVDVIGFGAGEPDFDTPSPIKEAGIAAIHDNLTRYTPAPGIMPLREAICQRLQEDCGLVYAPTQIVAASGAKHALYAALRVLVNPGDEVILPAPYWVSYLELIQMMGGVPVVVETTDTTGFKMTADQLKAAITPKTKALILNNPSNPTGMLYNQQELSALAQVVVDHDLYVVADEIYYRLVYDGLKFTSFASLGEEVAERTILINGVSKSYAMTGWRIGYAAASGPIAKLLSNYLGHSTGAPCTIAQHAAALALSAPQDAIEDMRQAFEARRNQLVARINAVPGVSCLLPEGAFYCMMNLSQLKGSTIRGTKIETADDFADAFLREGLVATVPGTGFGAPDYVRWSYATSMDNINEGVDRLAKFLG